MPFRAPNNRITPPVIIGPVTAQDPTNTILSIKGTLNNYQQLYLQNASTGDTASSDFIAGADTDVPGVVGRFNDFGVFNSNFVPTDSALGIIKTAAVSAGGTGYVVGDTLTISTGDANAQITVLTLSGSAVATFQIIDYGTNYTTGVKATTGGTGTGCTINITALYDYTVMAALDGYLYSSGGNEVIGTDLAGKVIKFATGGLSTANERGRFDDTGLRVMPALATPAGGTAGTGLRFGSATNLGVFFGSGVPTLSAAQGSLYLRTDGTTTNDRMYVNTNGTTGWTAVTTAA